ncbi:hypothetical protein LTR91_019140 [Friedmanniomyces endolithicus]|uniref:Uncharacterized protein n=1 Tax=Friedmanniomyces endolithicus TaxID=329885 RepID=A0AAN6HCJ9_9PEZI|nr:hypothetical protein LTR94_013015 [Friedmanniomyces endolithicus]KAK0775870.1 hypothetical protein LTR38_015710 [Friedmanniomyces endolithicus]KAK0813450.1 hypothetical protein LTR59_001236 [Friedmanniomyces endolithicus]KAK0821432.1 hypothetical protein LTR75_000907 [Friedmanniomyces endolithicus]KAK0831337.1 hypothetical protein LTR03_015487 [Friedmanniomyces endolithicus]
MLVLVTRAQRRAAEKAASATVSAATQANETHDESSRAFDASETPASVAVDTHLRSAAKPTSAGTASPSKKRGTKRRRSLSPVPAPYHFGLSLAQYPESDVRSTPLLAKPHITTSDAATPQTSPQETYLFAAPFLRPIAPSSLATPDLLPSGLSPEARLEEPKMPHFESYELGASKRQMWAKKRAAQKAEEMKK